MTVNDYLEFVGSGMMMTALKAFGKNTGCSLRYEWKKSREEAGGIGSKGPAKGEVDTFYWEYMIYRLHVAGNVIRDCEGMAPSYKKSILKGLHDLMDDMPMYLKAIALKKALDGCFLTLGRSSVILTREHVFTRLNELRAVETKCSGDPVRACIENVAKASGMEVTEGLLDYFDDETHGFAAAAAARMMELTPDRVYMEANAEKKFEGGGKSDMYA